MGFNLPMASIINELAMLKNMRHTRWLEEMKCHFNPK